MSCDAQVSHPYLHSCLMQPTGVDAACMTLALTCNLHSVNRKGLDAQVAYFLHTIHAHVPNACVILVRSIVMHLVS